MNSEVWELLSALLISIVGAGLTLLYTRRFGIIDVPNQRSSHTVPTPRGGGIALVASVALVAGYEITHSNHLSWPLLALLAASVVGLTLVGWLDDRGSMRITARLLVHLLCGLAVAMLVRSIAPLPLPIGIMWLLWWAFWTVASINIVNFMDGIDGMIALQGVVYGLFLFALLPTSNPGSVYGLILAGACLGFLVWNWAPARMFMGDVGSGPLGFFFVIGGALALEGARPAVVFLPLFPLFLDALITLVTRFRRGNKLTDAHRTHLYQRLANGGYGHALVTSWFALAAAGGASVALAVKDASPSWTTVAITVYTTAVTLLWMLGSQHIARHQSRSTQPSM